MNLGGLMGGLGAGGGLNAQMALNQQGLMGLGKKAAPELDPAAGQNSAGEALNQFGNMLKNQMQEISDLQAKADAATETYAVGGDIELHNVVLAVEKADMSMQLAMQIRNRMVSAYQEINRMSV